MQYMHDKRVDDDSAGSNSDPVTPLDYAPRPPRRKRLVYILVITMIVPIAVGLGLVVRDARQRQQQRNDHWKQMRVVYDTSVRRMNEDTRIGTQVEVTGVATHNKAGPVVRSGGDGYVAKIGNLKWPDAVVGQTVIVTGILRFAEGAPVSPEEPTKRIPYPVLESATWSLATQPASSPR